MKAKRSLGQNFFINSNLADYIVNILKDIDTDSLVEIGPGMGFFTERLINLFKNISVVEKDDSLANILKNKFPNINVINRDFLDLDISIFDKNCVYFGSLPYNVSKPIISKIIKSKDFSKKALFIVQKEVAEKYLYTPPYSSLSLITNIYADCKRIINISPESFKPKPNVNSSLISFTPNMKDIKNTERLEDLIHKAFRQPRKNIYNNLRNTEYEKGSIPYKSYRAQQLDLDKYIQILNNSL